MKHKIKTTWLLQQSLTQNTMSLSMNFVCIFLLSAYRWHYHAYCIMLSFRTFTILLCHVSNNSKIQSFQESPQSAETVANSSHNAFIKNCTHSNLKIFVVAVMANDSCYGLFDCRGHLGLKNCERTHFLVKSATAMLMLLPQ